MKGMPDPKINGPECSNDGCHHTPMAHCNLKSDGAWGCCYCLCENYYPNNCESLEKGGRWEMSDEGNA